MQVTGVTNKGKERPRNEDSCYAVQDSDLALLVVADGMGGHKAGNVASGIAVSIAEKYWNSIIREKPLSNQEAKSLVEEMIVEANQAVISEADNSFEKRGMGTTLTVGLLSGNLLIIGHIGDSRAYLVNNDRIELLTRDHSLLEQLLQSGQVKPEEAKNHPKRHVLTRALGASSELQVDIADLVIEPGSVLLFCTDGLTNQVEDHEILNVVTGQKDPQLQAESLIALANARGGHDNITVVIAADIGGQQE